MKKLFLAAAAMLSVAGGASAAIIPTLTSVTANGPNFDWLYQGTLAGDQGLVDGSRLVIFDFKGYVAGSVFSPYAAVTASVENISTGLILPPGMTDDPGIVNLVFTYHGPDFDASGGPFADINFNGLKAQSTFSDLVRGVFSAKAVKNNGVGPGGAGTPAFNTGFVTVPGGTGVPEPGVWAMMIMGFGLAGASLRRRRATA
jgi:hypothetical protein